MQGQPVEVLRLLAPGFAWGLTVLLGHLHLSEARLGYILGLAWAQLQLVEVHHEMLLTYMRILNAVGGLGQSFDDPVRAGPRFCRLSPQYC